MVTVSSFAGSSLSLSQGTRTKRQTYFQFHKEGVKCMLGQERNNLKSGTTSCRHHNNIVQLSLTKHTFLTKKRHGISSGKSFGSTNASPVFEGSRFELILEKIDVLLRFFRLPAVLCTELDAVQDSLTFLPSCDQVVGVISLSFLPVEAMSDLSPTFFLGLLKTLIPVVLMNLYTLGINQVYDVELDKVNKPYLPLASGELSVRTGVGIVALCSSTSIALAYLSQSPPLLLTVLTFFTFGGVYSVELPFMRWKKNAFLAVLCIVAMRGVALHVGTLLHVQGYVLGKPMVFTRPMIFTTIFMCTFKFVISLLKDLPDVDGDIAHDVQNFTVKFGKEKIFWLCNSLMLVAYGVAMVMGASSPILYSKLATIIGHGILASVLWLRARSIDLSDDSQTATFYLFVWKLIYVEYLLIHFVR